MKKLIIAIQNHPVTILACEEDWRVPAKIVFRTMAKTLRDELPLFKRFCGVIAKLIPLMRVFIALCLLERAHLLNDPNCSLKEDPLNIWIAVALAYLLLDMRKGKTIVVRGFVDDDKCKNN